MRNRPGGRRRRGWRLGLAAALAGGPEAGAGVSLGVSSSATRVFLGHTRAEEAAADSSGLRYMAEAGIDPAATLVLLGRFAGQEALTQGRQDLYVRSHPLTRDRIRAVEALVAGLKVAPLDQSASDYWYGRAKGKLSAFIRRPAWTLDRIPAKGGTEIEVLQRAVAYHRMPDPARAKAEIDRLAAAKPKDPYIHELRGQILLESRDFRGAVGAYARAAELAPRNPLILAGLGRAYLVTGQTGKALDVLGRARDRDPRNPGLLRDLARAHAEAGQNGLASLATAERYALLGRRDDAVLHAERALGQLPHGSPGWRRAEDILSLRQRKR